ncbi:MAG TPA: hypothetical protein VFS00_01310, partial [Polyangiaceae bacterium]|nr:hypothetical protein [Polyangiaceae bacterium]
MKRAVVALALALALAACGCERSPDGASPVITPSPDAAATSPNAGAAPSPNAGAAPSPNAGATRGAAPSPNAGATPATSPAAYPAPATSAGAPGAPRKGPTFVELPADAGLLDAIRGEARAASGAGETLVVYVGARWCKPCQHFEQALASGKLDEPLAGLRLLHVDLDARGAELAAQGYATNVIPYFVVPTPKGTPSARKFSTSTMG